MQQTAMSFATGLKRLVILVVVFWSIGAVWKFSYVKRRCLLLSDTCAKFVDLRFAIMEEELKQLSVDLGDGHDAALKTRSVRLAATLKSFVIINPYLKELAYVQGSGKEGIKVVRTQDGVKQVDVAALEGQDPVLQAHQKGQVVTSKLDYTNDSIPTFDLAYPLDGPSGGSLSAKVDLWEFLKPPTAFSKQIIPDPYNLEIFDAEGKLLAFKTGKKPLFDFLARYFAAVSSTGRLGFTVKVAPNQEVLRSLLNPKHAGAYALTALILVLVI